MEEATNQITNDGLLEDENRNLLDRVLSLEKKSAEDHDEIVCLKSAIADILRRLKTLESGKGTPIPRSTSGRLPPSGLESSHNFASQRSLTTVDSSSRKNLAPTTGKRTPLTPSKKSAPIAKSPGFTKSRSMQGDKVSGSRGQPQYIQKDGIIKTYLRGRAINSYLPTELIESYEFDSTLDEPEESLKLEWVYGYRGKDCRDNVHFLPTGEIVYFVAAVAVLYNVEEHSQRHYLGHNDDIKCICVHPDKMKIATGQVTGHDKHHGKAHVRIWNSVNLETLHIIGMGDLERGVCCISFSKTDNGAMLAVVDEAQDHILSVWDWQKQKKVTETKASGDPILVVEFSPVDETSLVTCGKNHLAFWTFHEKQLTKKMGIYEKHEKPRVTICLTYAENGDLITGDSSGNIYSWPKGEQRIGQAIVGAHDGGVFSLCFTKEGHLMSGGGKDRRVVQWDSAHNPTGLESELLECYGPVRTITEGPGGMLIVGTTKSTILQANVDLNFSPIVQGQTEEFWALATHPNTHQFVTAGKDSQVTLWDALSRRAVWTTKVSLQIHCAAYYPVVAGKEGFEKDMIAMDPIIALGAVNGKWLVMDIARHEVIAVHSDAASEQVECISYSPNGKYLAVGGRDNYIYIYNVMDAGQRYSKIGRCQGHSSFILHVDWSKDSDCLRSMSGDYEVLYWSPKDCKQISSASSLRDVDWASHSVTLGWDVCGMWNESADGTDLNACCVSSHRTLLVSADDSSKVNLFKFPCAQLNAKHKTYLGHSSHVTNVEFLFDDSLVISTGGKDTAVLQWEIKN